MSANYVNWKAIREAPHWSASRFMLFEQCPRAYKERYVDGVLTRPSLAMLFGNSVHAALEELLQGYGGGCSANPGPFAEHYVRARGKYLAGYMGMVETFKDTEITLPDTLFGEGLRMIDQVAALGLNDDALSKSERWFSLHPRWTALDLPTIGAVDLWSQPWSKHGAVVWDFKTTVGGWSAQRADRERWQPLLYTWAYFRTYEVIPTFKYLVLNRVSGDMQIFDRTWTVDDWSADVNDLRFHMEEISEAVRDGDFSCTRGHGSCPECGKPYGHDHVCADASRPKIKLLKAAATTV